MTAEEPPSFFCSVLFPILVHMSQANPTKLEYPQTVIVVHVKERPKKCSVQPLRKNPDFLFLDYPIENPPKLENYVRLAMEGPVLSPADSEKGLLILDASWRLAKRMNDTYSHVVARSLPVWKTAYPRVSKFSVDPAHGLATIEAIYAAYQILGRSTKGLLDDYYWGEKFLEANGITSTPSNSSQRAAE